MTKGSWALFPPCDTDLTGGQPSGALLPEDGRLTLKGGWLLLKNDTPNTVSFNNHYVAQWSNPDVETGVGEPLVSLWHFAVVKFLAYLVLKECPYLSGFKPSYTNICYSIAPHCPIIISLQSSTQ